MPRTHWVTEVMAEKVELVAKGDLVAKAMETGMENNPQE